MDTSIAVDVETSLLLKLDYDMNVGIIFTVRSYPCDK